MTKAAINTLSSRFKQTRKHHSLEAAEDYTELVYDLINKNGEARTGQIAEALGVSHVTALRTVQRLQKQGYLKTAYKQPIQLTAAGKKLAVSAKRRHQLLVDFLLAIGVSEKTAEIDAEGAEHHFSPETFSRMVRFLGQR